MVGGGEEFKHMRAIKERYLYRNVCSGVIIAALALFLFLLRYDIPLYGDDVGWLVLNNVDDEYLDNDVIEGECTLNLDYSFKMTWERISHAYLKWDGRVISRAVMPVIRLIFTFPDGTDWILFSVYIMGVLMALLIVMIQVICGSIRKGMQAPGTILLTAVLLYIVPEYSYAYMTRLIMYVFANIYVLSVILYLVFYMVVRRIYTLYTDLKTENECTAGSFLTARRLVGINLLGLLAGLSHEAYGVIFGMVLFVQLVRFWLQNRRTMSIRYLFMYVGYFTGFCICFFAPGNFNRAQQSHESALHTVSLVERLLNSIYIHAFVAYKIWIVPCIVLPFLTIFIAVLLRKKILIVKDILLAVLNNLEWFLGFAMSAVTWGLVTRVVNYGMLAANVLLIIGVIRVFRELWMLVTDRIMARDEQVERVRKVIAGVSMAAVVLLCMENYAEMLSAHKVADVWRENLRVARKVGMKEITVPAYPEDLEARFYDLNAINNQDRYDKVACQVVYGTKVVIEHNMSGQYNGGEP